MAAFPTSTTVLDSILFRDAFGTPRIREVFFRFQPDISRGLIVAEAVMMGLAPDTGRQEAHDVVYRATIERLTSPKNYLGLAPEMVDRVLASAKR
jgi:hypothetical protein